MAVFTHKDKPETQKELENLRGNAAIPKTHYLRGW